MKVKPRKPRRAITYRMGMSPGSPRIINVVYAALLQISSNDSGSSEIIWLV